MKATIKQCPPRAVLVKSDKSEEFIARARALDGRWVGGHWSFTFSQRHDVIKAVKASFKSVEIVDIDAAELDDVNAQQRAERKRKEDTRRKIVLGAIALKELIDVTESINNGHPVHPQTKAFAEHMQMLIGDISSARDRVLFDSITLED